MAQSRFEYLAIYGVALDVYFSTEDPADVDDLYIGTAFAADDAKISKDGGAVVSTTNVPAQVTASQPIYKLTLTATEMQARFVFVTIRDQTATEVFAPISILITTRVQIGELKVDTTQIGGNVVAVDLQGVGSGAGLRSTAGATGIGGLFRGGATSGQGLVGQAQGGNSAGLDCIGFGSEPGVKSTGGASGDGIRASGGGAASGIVGVGGLTGVGILGSGGATSGNGIFGLAPTSGHGIAGTGAGGGSGFTGTGQGVGHGFSGTAGASGKITNFFDTLEGTEPTAAIGNNATFAVILQHLKRRFTNKVTQTTTVQTVFRDDSTTVLETGTVSDDGTTQSKNKFA